MTARDVESVTNEIDSLLLNAWDPIGVKEISEARDEYTRYARKISQMLLEGRDAFAITKYLRDLESGMLSTPANEKRVEEVVKLILSAYNK